MDDKIRLFMSTDILHSTYTDKWKWAREYTERRTGLKISTDPNHTYRLLVELKETARVCEIVESHERNVSKESKVLDFQEIFKRNEARNQEWKNFLPQLAKTVLDTCKRCLEVMPDLYYGIPHEMSIRDETGGFPFCETFLFYNINCKYSTLTPSKIKDLIRTMNAMISHGDVRAELIEKHGLNVYFRRNHDKVVETAYLDYAHYYEKYDKMTTQLEEVLQEIATNAVPADAANQIQGLKPNRRLCYHFNSSQKKFPDFATLKTRLSEGTPHYESLLKAVEKAVPGIRVSQAKFLHYTERWASPRGCAHGIRSYDERIEFEYEIIAQDADISEIVRKQLQTEWIIKYIMEYRYPEIATRLIETIIRRIDVASKDDARKRSISYCLMNSGIKVNNQKVPIKLKVDEEIEITIDLSKIENQEFLNAIAAEIAKQSRGMLELQIERHANQYDLSLQLKARS